MDRRFVTGRRWVCVVGGGVLGIDICMVVCMLVMIRQTHCIVDR